MAIGHPDLYECTTPATLAEVKLVTNTALKIWEHPVVQAIARNADQPAIIDSGFQTIGKTDMFLSFQTPSQLYPTISISTEEKFLDATDDPELKFAHEAGLVLSNKFVFSACSRFFGLPKYQARDVSGTLSIEDPTISHEEAAILLPKQTSWLGPRQLARITKGRQESAVQFSQRHAKNLLHLLREFDPQMFAEQPSEDTGH